MLTRKRGDLFSVCNWMQGAEAERGVAPELKTEVASEFSSDVPKEPHPTLSPPGSKFSQVSVLWLKSARRLTFENFWLQHLALSHRLSLPTRLSLSPRLTTLLCAPPLARIQLVSLHSLPSNSLLLGVSVHNVVLNLHFKNQIQINNTHTHTHTHTHACMHACMQPTHTSPGHC